MKMFFITLFFGYFGVHKFMQGDAKKGILYLFTFGLFGIGWIADTVKAFEEIFIPPKQYSYSRSMESYNSYNSMRSATKKDMLQLQQLILPGQSKLIMSLNDLERHSTQIITRYAEIVDDCNYLIGTTEKPETFFGRYELLLETLNNLKKFEPFYSFSGYLPSQQYDYNISVKQVRIQELTNRAYNKSLIKADSLKTERGKKNQFIKAYDLFMEYRNEMNNDTLQYIKDKFGSKFEISDDAINDDIISLTHDEPISPYFDELPLDSTLEENDLEM